MCGNSLLATRTVPAGLVELVEAVQHDEYQPDSREYPPEQVQDEVPVLPKQSYVARTRRVREH